MPTTEYAGNVIQLNEEGFLVDSSEWTPEVATTKTRRESVNMILIDSNNRSNSSSRNTNAFPASTCESESRPCAPTITSS